MASVNQAGAGACVWGFVAGLKWTGGKKKGRHAACAACTLAKPEMGKSRTTKFKRPQFNAVGLPVNAVKEAVAEEDDYDDDCPAADLLEKVGTLSCRVFTSKLLFFLSRSRCR